VQDSDLDLWAATVLPGDDLFPCAGALGLAPLVRERLAIVGGPEAVKALPALSGLDEAAREAAVAAFEQAEPALFEALFRTLCLTYYGRPEVTAAIAASGLPYHATLQPKGYAMAPFDPDRDTPRHQRGHWLRTEEVAPVVLPEGLR